MILYSQRINISIATTIVISIIMAVMIMHADNNCYYNNDDENRCYVFSSHWFTFKITKDGSKQQLENITFLININELQRILLSKRAHILRNVLAHND